jgi:hypothetical protein
MRKRNLAIAAMKAMSSSINLFGQVVQPCTYCQPFSQHHPIPMVSYPSVQRIISVHTWFVGVPSEGDMLLADRIKREANDVSE